MPHSPLVSVIVTTFQRPKYLQKTLESILSQTYTHLEVIVVDDGSADSTADVVDVFSDKRIQFFSINHSGRPAVPRNYGLSVAAGEYIAFCDDDDIWSPDKIEMQVSSFLKSSGIKLCYTDVSLIDEHDQIIEPSQKSQKVSRDIVTFQSQLIRNDITFSTVMIHYSVLSNGFKFDERPILKASEDYLFLTHIVHLHPVYYILRPLVQYRIHKNGISYSYQSPKRMLMFYKRLVLCLFDFLKSKKINMRQFLKLTAFHLSQVVKLILFPYYERICKFWRSHV